MAPSPDILIQDICGCGGRMGTENFHFNKFPGDEAANDPRTPF